MEHREVGELEEEGAAGGTKTKRGGNMIEEKEGRARNDLIKLKVGCSSSMALGEERPAQGNARAPSNHSKSYASAQHFFSPHVEKHSFHDTSG